MMNDTDEDMVALLRDDFVGVHVQEAFAAADAFLYVVNSIHDRMVQTGALRISDNA